MAEHADAAKPRSRINLVTFFVAITAFAAGLSTRNISDGVRALSVQLTVPSSTTPICPGDILLVESPYYPELDRRVTVLRDGTIALKKIGSVDVGGQSIASAESLLNISYSRYLQAPLRQRSPKIQIFRDGLSGPNSLTYNARGRTTD